MKVCSNQADSMNTDVIVREVHLCCHCDEAAVCGAPGAPTAAAPLKTMQELILILPHGERLSPWPQEPWLRPCTKRKWGGCV